MMESGGSLLRFPEVAPLLLQRCWLCPGRECNIIAEQSRGLRRKFTPCSKCPAPRRGAGLHPGRAQGDRGCDWHDAHDAAHQGPAAPPHPHPQEQVGRGSWVLVWLFRPAERRAVVSVLPGPRPSSTSGVCPLPSFHSSSASSLPPPSLCAGERVRGQPLLRPGRNWSLELPPVQRPP